jgi:hypothetical protein
MEPMKDSCSDSGDISILLPKNPPQEPEKVRKDSGEQRKKEIITIGEQYTPFQLSQFSSFNPKRISTANVSNLKFFTLEIEITSNNLGEIQCNFLIIKNKAYDTVNAQISIKVAESERRSMYTLKI